MSLFGPLVAGVDIGHASLKVVGLRLGRRPQFIGCKEIAVEPQYLQKEGMSDPVLVGQSLRSALAQAAPRPIRTRNAYLSLSESLVFRKVFELPSLENREEFQKAVRLEAVQYLPRGAEEMELDYQSLGLTPDKKLEQVMMVAVEKKLLGEVMAIFKEAKLNLVGIDTKPAALGRAIVRPGENETMVIVDVGSELSTIAVCEGNIIRVTSLANLGGNVIRDPESKEVVEEKQAERLKRLAEAINEEIEHVVKYYTNRTVNQKKLKEVRLTGGGSMIKGMKEALSAITDLKVIVGQPVVAVPPFCDRRFYSALGSALYPLYGHETN